MNQGLGKQMIEKNVITEEQLKRGLERQRLHGGRLGYNLVALGIISEEELSSFFLRVPEAPKNLEQTGLPFPFIVDLVLKHIQLLSDFSLQEIAGRVKLPQQIVEKALDELRKEHFLEVKGGTQLMKSTFRYVISEQGKRRAGELMEVCRYMGPAPVTLDDYRSMVEVQTVKNIMVDETHITRAFSHIIVGDEVMRNLGPAVSSGKAIFLYGPPGNGKTTIAETVGAVLPGSVFIPYALLVGGEIITVFDPVNHVPASPEEMVTCENCDSRWVQIKRPMIMVGGELTLQTLELNFNHVAKIYEAPLQMKANNGLFIVDDFGRQQLDPQQLLNRWIVPLERRTDFLTLHTGMKFEIPFDQLVVFSTNLDPKTLVDEAFLRRIRYKVKIDHPSVEEYLAIFRKVCESNSIPFDPEVFNYLVDEFYQKRNVKLSSCHPRDLIDQIIDEAHYRNHRPQLSKESISAAWHSYFVEM